MEYLELGDLNLDCSWPHTYRIGNVYLHIDLAPVFIIRKDSQDLSGLAVDSDKLVCRVGW